MMKIHITLLILILTSCLQPVTQEKKVQYSIFVFDKSSNTPLSSASIFLKSSNLNYDTLSSNATGHAESHFLQGDQVLFVITKEGYYNKDTLDILSKDTTNSTESIVRVMRVYMDKVSSSSSVLSSSSSYVGSSSSSSIILNSSSDAGLSSSSVNLKRFSRDYYFEF